MRPVFVRWRCGGCGEKNTVSVPSGYVWEKELACRTCHRVFTEASSPDFQVHVHLDSHPRDRIHTSPSQRH